jgi:DNA (cytosine-5)-methyltransferase 1
MIKIIELFSGIGSQVQALKNAGIDHEVVAISEIDKYALISYRLMHGYQHSLGDITKVKTSDIPDADMITYSFPCQDISVAGQGLGLDENSGTKSSLLWNVKTFIDTVRPKYLLLENVKNLVGKNHIDNFLLWLDYLHGLGYTNHWKVLNSKDFDIPQSRERVFVVSVLGESHFQFPTGHHTAKTIYDILEDDVHDKYYMKKKYTPRDVPSYSGRGLIHIGNLDVGNNEALGRVYDPNGLCPTLTTMTGGYRQPKILLGDRVRRFTPRECWRVMGFKDREIDLVRPHMSDAQMYKQAGNTIVVNVLEAIFREMFKKEE